MAVAKKATKKAAKKVVKKTTRKKAVSPAKAAEAAHLAQVTAARLLLTHELVKANDLRVGDQFTTNNRYNGPRLIGLTHDWSTVDGGEAVIFQGINAQGLLVCQWEDGEVRLPVEAVDFSDITHADDLRIEEVVSLNNSYAARVSPDSHEVAVGCQRIHIDRVREVVAAYDKINGATPRVQNRETTLVDGLYTELTYVAK